MIIFLIILGIVVDVFIFMKLKKVFSILKEKEKRETHIYGEAKLTTYMEFGAFYVYCSSLILIPITLIQVYKMIN